MSSEAYALFWRRLPAVAAGLLLLLISGACGPVPAGAPSPLDPQTAATASIAQLGWVMIALGTAVCAAVFAALLGALFRPRRPVGGEAAAPAGAPDRGGGNTAVVIGGMALPALVIVFVLGYTIVTLREVAGAGGPGAALHSPAGDPHGAHADHGAHAGSGAAGSGRAGGEPAIDVRVIGRQWWWDVVYPDAQVITANEIHVPAGAPIRLTVTSQDVIHSFWVPQVAGKVDALPGKTNAITFRVDQPGVYRGLCSEFCGLQHAHMHFSLIVEPPEAFAGWLAAQQRVPPAPNPDEAPAESLVAQGQRVFLRSSCAQCHAVRGTAAAGTRGPDLTHVASRRTLGAGTHENTPANLARWVIDPQAMKPGNKMPEPNLTEGEVRAVVAYLETLE